MGLYAWALDETKAPEHRGPLSREHALRQQMAPLIGGPAQFTNQRIHLDAISPDLNSHKEWGRRSSGAAR